MKTVILGYHTMGCLGLQALLDHAFKVEAVFTHRDDPREEIWWESLADKARLSGIPVHYPEGAKDPLVEKEIARIAPDFMFSFYYRYMIPAAVLALAKKGALNLHGSLLPRYRGRAPVNWVLVNGETETGASLHYMTAKADAGDLVDQERVAIAHEDTAFTLYKKLEIAARRLLDRALPSLREGTTKGLPMDLKAGSYFGGRKPDDGTFDWTWPAEKIYNLIRAVTHPYPGAFTQIRGKKVLVWWAVPLESAFGATPGAVIESDRNGVTVATGSGALRLITVQPEHGPELPVCTYALLEGIHKGDHL